MYVTHPTDDASQCHDLHSTRRPAQIWKWSLSTIELYVLRDFCRPSKPTELLFFEVNFQLYYIFSNNLKLTNHCALYLSEVFSQWWTLIFRRNPQNNLLPSRVIEICCCLWSSIMNTTWLILPLPNVKMTKTALAVICHYCDCWAIMSFKYRQEAFSP